MAKKLPDREGRGHCAALCIAWLARQDAGAAGDPFQGKSFEALAGPNSPQQFVSYIRQVQNSEKSRAEIFRNITSGPCTDEAQQAVELLDMMASPAALVREYHGAFGGCSCTVGKPVRYNVPYDELSNALLSSDGRYTINTSKHAMALVVRNGSAWFFDPNCGTVAFPRSPAGINPGAARFIREYLSNPIVAGHYGCTDGVWVVHATPNAALVPAASSSSASSASSAASAAAAATPPPSHHPPKR